MGRRTREEKTPAEQQQNENKRFLNSRISRIHFLGFQLQRGYTIRGSRGEHDFFFHGFISWKSEKYDEKAKKRLRFERGNQCFHRSQRAVCSSTPASFLLACG